MNEGPWGQTKSSFFATRCQKITITVTKEITSSAQWIRSTKHFPLQKDYSQEGRHYPANKIYQFPRYKTALMYLCHGTRARARLKNAGRGKNIPPASGKFAPARGPLSEKSANRGLNVVSPNLGPVCACVPYVRCFRRGTLSARDCSIESCGTERESESCSSAAGSKG